MDLSVAGNFVTFLVTVGLFVVTVGLGRRI